MGKRKDFIFGLDDDQLYSASSLADEAVKTEVIHTEKRKNFRQNLNHWKPKTSPDGFIDIPQQGPIPAWFGWRWKSVYKK